MKAAPFLGVLLLVVSAFVVADQRGQRTRGTTAASVSTTHKIDPRTLDATDPHPSYPLSYFRFIAGKKYVYHFESKAAHTMTSLPNPDKVVPQIALEDLGLFPFTVVSGAMTLESVCLTTTRKMMFQVTFSNVTADCTDDAARVNNSCPSVIKTALSLMDRQFWFTHSARGEIIALDFLEADPVELRSFKQSLVFEISMTTPNLTRKEKPEMFGRFYEVNNKTIATRYRVSAYTKNPHSNDKIDGIIVRKERFTSRPSLVPRINNLPPFTYRRNTWVYMVIGGDVAPSSGPAPVPTRIASIEETQIDPAHAVYENPGHQDPLFVLSRLTLTLRAILPGRDLSSQLLINDTCGLNELDNFYAKHYRPRPPVSFLEQRESLRAAGSLSPTIGEEPALTAAVAPSPSFDHTHVDSTEDLLDSPRDLLLWARRLLAA